MALALQAEGGKVDNRQGIRFHRAPRSIHVFEAVPERFPATIFARGSTATNRSASTRPVDGPATVHRCTRRNSRTRRSNSGRDRARDRPRSKDDAGPHDAADRIVDILTVHHGIGRFCTDSQRTESKQSKKQVRRFHGGLTDRLKRGCSLRDESSATASMTRPRQATRPLR